MSTLESVWGGLGNTFKECKKRSSEEVKELFSKYWQDMGMAASAISNICVALDNLFHDKKIKKMKGVSELKEKMKKVRTRNDEFLRWLQHNYEQEVKKLLKPGTHKLGFGMSPEVFREPIDIKFHLLMPLHSGYSDVARRIYMLKEQPTALEIMEQEDKKSGAKK